MTAPSPGVVMVSGPNGAGKTALVRRIVGALYVDASGLSVAAVLQRVYELAFNNDPVSVPTPELLHKLLESRRVPIIIDDFRGSTEDLHKLIDTLKTGAIVYTSVDADLIDPSVAELRLTGLRTAAARELFERALGSPLADDDPNVALVNGPLEGNPLLILQAGALARSGKLPPVQSAAALAAAIFNSMTIGEQQIFATVAGFNGARPDRATVEAVSGVSNAQGVMNALVARSTIETDGELFWISPLMFSVTGVAPSLMRYDALFDYLERTLAQDPLPKSLLTNPAPFFVGLRFAMAKGRHLAVMTGSRAVSDALLLAGNIDGSRQAAELVRETANELRDQAMQGWAAHQLGTLSALVGDQADAVSWLETAVTRRERIGDETGMHRSMENLALIRGEPSPAARRAKKRGGMGRDLGMIAAAMCVAAVGVAAYALVWLPSHRLQHGHYANHVVAAAPAATSHATQRRKPPHEAPAPVPRPLVSHARRAPATLAPKKLVALAPVVHVAPPRVIVPRIVRFAAARSAIQAGQTTSLCYDVRGAQSAVLDPGGSVVPGASCTQVRPARSTRYVLTASRGGKNTVATLAVNVASAPDPRPRILRFTISSRHLNDGQYAQLCFSLQRATSVVLEPIGPLSSAHSGCLSISPRIDTDYTLYARNHIGITSRSIHVAVTADDILSH